uniref:Uncharacterized protein n=1 Tax=viral metagenome TaxID=1070528 RepID=A0A6C0LIU3_9ZZZZ|tara:strand:+ start:1312 stop:1695 length:384 start_codon:yes stop_codon:yes gene_type:complete
MDKKILYNMKKFPYELVNIIIDYDGRIKYKLNNAIDYHKYVNVIHKYDERYNIITPIIDKKCKIMKYTAISHNKTSFYFEFAFDKQPNLMLWYDYCWSDNNEFEIGYIDMTGSGRVFGSNPFRTIYK